MNKVNIFYIFNYYYFYNFLIIYFIFFSIYEIIIFSESVPLRKNL